LHDIELAYYRKFNNKDTQLAKLKGYEAATKTMFIEKLKGQTCRAFIDSKSDNAKLGAVNSLIKKFKTSMETTWNLPVTYEDDEDAIKAAIIKELYSSIDDRVEPCMHMIQSVIDSNDIKSIDDMPISEHGKVMSAIDDWLQSKMDEGYFDTAYVHGDPNTDNVMICGKELRFVDPRGYFGNLKTLGLGIKQYDVAKFVYGLSGYGRFNSAEYVATMIRHNNVQAFIGPSELPGISDVSLFDIKVDDDIKVMVGIIWLKLTSYIINDPIKSVLAYMYGNALLTKLLNIK
jgi:hypothetical protein